MWDDTNVSFTYQPSSALNQRATYSFYYGDVKDYLDENGKYVFMLCSSEWEEYLIEMEEIERRERSGEKTNEEPEGGMTVSLRKRFIREETFLY